MLGVLELMLETGVDLLPALGIDVGFGLIPNTNEILYLVHTTRVMILHLPHGGTTTDNALDRC